MQKISIIIPVFNIENYISKCLESIVNQSYKNIEILCINDGSTDNSGNICDKFALLDSRIKVFHKENQGVSSARNLGIKESCGDYIMFVDGDDWIDSETCSNAIKEIEYHRADILMWSYVKEYSNNSIRKKIFKEEIIIFENENLVSNLRRRFIGLINDELRFPENADALSPVCCKLYRSETIKKNNVLFLDHTYEDGLFNFEVFKFMKKAVFVNKFWYHYRKSLNTSITGKYKKQLYSQTIRLFDIINKKINYESLCNNYEIALQNRICLSIIGLGLNEISKDNDASIIKKMDSIRNIIKSELYTNAYNKLNLRYFPFHWKFFFFCVKHKYIVIVFYLLLIIKKVVNK